MSQILLRIKSKYNLKEIFLLIDYDHILKLIKNNNQLKKSLDINLLNYKQRSSFQYLERKKIIKKMPCKSDIPTPYIINSMRFALILFIYTLIFASVLAVKGSFNEKNIKKNSDKNIVIFIKKINLSLFGFAVYIIVSYIIGFGIMAYCQVDFFITKVIKIFVIIIFLIIFFFYDILIIVKLILSYKIKNCIITWFIICDYLLIIIISLYFTYIAYISYDYISFVIKYKCMLLKKREMILLKFRDLKINEFMLPEYFYQMDDYEKRKYILNNKDKYEIISSRNQKDLISSINKIRYDNNIDDLIYEIKVNYQDLIFDTCSEPILYNNKNIFRFSDGSYLLKYYSFNEFIKRLNKCDSEIKNIILINNLNKIFIVRKDNMIFILLFRSKNTSLISDDDYDYNDITSEPKIKVKEEEVIYAESSFSEGYKYYDY